MPVSGAGMGAASVVATVDSLVVATVVALVVAAVVDSLVVAAVGADVVAVVTAALIVVLVMDEVDDVEALQLDMPLMDKNAIKRTRIKTDF